MNHKPTENDKAKSLSLNRLHQYRHAQARTRANSGAALASLNPGFSIRKRPRRPNPRSCCVRSVTSAGSTMRTSLRRASTSSAARAKRLVLGRSLQATRRTDDLMLSTARSTGTVRGAAQQ